MLKYTLSILSFASNLKALLEERKLYCFCLGHFCSVVQNQIRYSSKVRKSAGLLLVVGYLQSSACNVNQTLLRCIDFVQTHSMFSSHVINWQTACSSPNELPSESNALLTVSRNCGGKVKGDQL